jgi:hypothetical protein
MPAWSDAAGQDETRHSGPPKNRSTTTAYQKLVRSPSKTLRASSGPINLMAPDIRSSLVVINRLATDLPARCALRKAGTKFEDAVNYILRR